MDQSKTPLALFAAGAAAGLTMTYAARSARARLRKPIVQAMTVVAQRRRVEAFVEERDRMIEALGSQRSLPLIERLELRDAPGDRGTEVYLSMRGMGMYAVKDVLRRMKALIEAGEIPTGKRYA
jgi:hypothetical protein